MAAHGTNVTFRLDPPSLERLNEIQRRLTERTPGVTITRVDALKYLIATGSGSALAAVTPVQQQRKTGT